MVLDNIEAVKWYRKAAEQGHELAQYNLAMCYGAGIGIEESYDEAIVWLRKAAAQGMQQAIDMLINLGETM